MIKKADLSGCSPYAGSGKLSDYKKDGSWMMNQIEKGYDKVERGITVDNTGDYIKFAKIASKIVKSSINLEIIKKYKKLSEGQIALKFSIQSNINGTNMSQLSAIQELLYIEKKDIMKKLQLVCKFNVMYKGQVFINFNNHSINLECLIKTDDVEICDKLNKFSFI